MNNLLISQDDAIIDAASKHSPHDNLDLKRFASVDVDKQSSNSSFISTFESSTDIFIDCNFLQNQTARSNPTSWGDGESFSQNLLFFSGKKVNTKSLLSSLVLTLLWNQVAGGKCSTGYYLSNRICRKCPIGTYYPLSGSPTACYLCPATSKCPNEAMATAIGCTSPTPYSSADGTACTMCPRGYYYDGTNCAQISALLAANQKINDMTFSRNDFKENFIALNSSEKFTLLSLLTDDQVKSLSDNDLKRLALYPEHHIFTARLSVENMATLIESRPIAFSKLADYFLKNYNYPTCYPGYELGLFRIAHSIIRGKADATEYYSNRTYCSIEDIVKKQGLSYATYLEMIKPYFTRMVYKIIDEYPKLEGFYSNDTTYIQNQTSLDAKVSNIFAKDLSDPNFNVTDLILKLSTDARGPSINVNREKCRMDMERLKCLIFFNNRMKSIVDAAFNNNYYQFIFTSYLRGIYDFSRSY